MPSLCLKLNPSNSSRNDLDQSTMASQEQNLHIVSLGSSFGAGPGIPPQLKPRAAMRSGRNYPHLLAQRLDAKLTDLTVSGATLLNIIQEPQTAPLSAQVFPPQIDGVPTDADIITITAGGNDINYIGQMLSDAWGATSPGMISNTVMHGVRAVSSIFTTSAPEPQVSISHEALIDRFVGILDAVHQKAPKARIYLVEYLAVLGPDTQPGQDIPFDQEKIDYHRDVASTLQKAYSAAAERRSEWCERVPVHELSLLHALGSEEPWVGGFDLSTLLRRSGPVLHPNLEGMKAVAEILLPKVQKKVP